MLNAVLDRSRGDPLIKIERPCRCCQPVSERNPFNSMAFHGAESESTSKQREMDMRFLTEFLTIIVAGLMVVSSGCAVNPVTGKQELAFYEMPEAKEIEIGRTSFGPAIQQMNGEYDDPALSEYVNRVGLRVARVSHRPQLPYQFKVVNDSTPNAFALPGGSIAITRGLLVNLENEAQLAAVLGHEVGHVTARHAVQGIQRGMLLNLGLVLLSETTGTAAYGPAARQTGELAAVLIDNRYSREQERESDRLGIDYMVQAGYNPLGSVQLQQFFLQQSEGERDPLWIEGLFRTHPFSRDRMRENQAYIETRYPRTMNSPDYQLNTEAFRKATARLRASREGYERYDRGREFEGEKQLDAALVQYRKAIALVPDEYLFHTALGIALFKKGDLEGAQNALGRAVGLNSNFYQSHLALGLVALQKGQTQAAVTELDRSLTLLPNVQTAFYLAEAYEKSGNFQKAHALYGEVAAADPNGRLGRTAAARMRSLEGR